ncbi:hypothetical protein COV20_04900 [Candidatus Woesearchaeota archaeon CG10_big_fil_rev_8_21_14_0_10_45_16]|nr:MAG: hypothetical protein COV20_04900 [Candidatus Woesearchaeota archaeon CG10_big_fil_rev_8_21_14_0_10_45_16]
MMNLLLMKKDPDTEKLSGELGFTETLFSNSDFAVVEAVTTKELLKKTNEAKRKNLLVVFRPATEELLRFALEHSRVDIIFGQEMINPKDSFHYLRGALDQVTCRIAAEKGKTIAFSFAEIQDSDKKGRLLGRMMQNIKLCQKYKVKMLFSTFADSKERLRSTQDLAAFWRVLGGVKLESGR